LTEEDAEKSKIKRESDMLKLLKKLGKVALTSSLILAPATQVAFAQESSGEFEGEKVNVGVVGDNGAEVWGYVADKALEQEGIEIDVTRSEERRVGKECRCR